MIRSDQETMLWEVKQAIVGAKTLGVALTVRNALVPVIAATVSECISLDCNLITAQLPLLVEYCGINAAAGELKVNSEWSHEHVPLLRCRWLAELMV